MMWGGANRQKASCRFDAEEEDDKVPYSHHYRYSFAAAVAGAASKNAWVTFINMPSTRRIVRRNFKFLILCFLVKKVSQLEVPHAALAYQLPVGSCTVDCHTISCRCCYFDQPSRCRFVLLRWVQASKQWWRGKPWWMFRVNAEWREIIVASADVFVTCLVNVLWFVMGRKKGTLEISPGSFGSRISTPKPSFFFTLDTTGFRCVLVSWLYLISAASHKSSKETTSQHCAQ